MQILGLQSPARGLQFLATALQPQRPAHEELRVRELQAVHMCPLHWCQMILRRTMRRITQSFSKVALVADGVATGFDGSWRTLFIIQSPET